MRLAVLASGGGSNLQAILDSIERGALRTDVELVLTDRINIGALDRAERRGIPTAVLKPSDFEGPDAFGAAMMERFQMHEIDFVALAGYLRHIPADVVRSFRHRMVNVHPSLLPAFGGRGLYGMRVHQAVIDYGARWTGATVHLVDEEYDTGPIVLQEPVAVLPHDTAESLAARVLHMEHRLYPLALQHFAEGRVRIEGRRVIIDQ